MPDEDLFLDIVAPVSVIVLKHATKDAVNVDCRAHIC